MSGSTVCPGPASHTFYEVPPSLRTRLELNVPGRFRAELSLAYSRTYHLKAHAIVLSYLEQRPLFDYIDRHAYALSQAFYETPRSAASDILNTKADIAACRRLHARDQLPRDQTRAHAGPDSSNETNW